MPCLGLESVTTCAQIDMHVCMPRLGLESVTTYAQTDNRMTVEQSSPPHTQQELRRTETHSRCCCYTAHACSQFPSLVGCEQVWSSSQSPHSIMQATAMVLGLAQSRCTARCRRMGGAFGGKTTRSCVPAAAVAVAANKLKRQVCTLVKSFVACMHCP